MAQCEFLPSSTLKWVTLQDWPVRGGGTFRFTAFAWFHSKRTRGTNTDRHGTTTAKAPDQSG
eukprot:494632-Rhodomonas_salina.2